jgi:hypothetical protein
MYKFISIITFIYSCTIISNGLQIVHKSHIYRSLPLLNGVVNKGPSIFDDDNQIKLCSNRSGSIDSGKGAN